MRVLLSLMLVLAGAVQAQSQPATAPKTIAEATMGMQKFDGFFPFYWDESKGKVWLEIDKWQTEVLYINSLPAGVGSNDIGLDRGQLGGSRIVTFEKHGPRVLLIQPNYDFRAITDNEQERQSVQEAFARSVLWGFEAGARDGDRVLVDATDFFLRDAHNVAGRLKNAQQGSYRLDNSRSAFYLPRTKNFPKNTEIEVTLTFTGEPAGWYIRSVTPSPDAVTVRQHHSFVALPEPGYQPRTLDPRAGYFGISFMDYATPIDQPIVKRYLSRHRLQKKNPGAAPSEPVTPIVYYVDPGAPEPIRSALIDGARWWNSAFEAAGFLNAFHVELLPPDADPMDVRYNTIQWVHRSTRGWSYGSSVRDPRTGEIIKGHVTLGSLRVRQDFMIAEGLLAPYAEGQEGTAALQEMALARIRQLSAHEVGHTLGLAHNFAASISGRASVMDYPHPLVTMAGDGRLSLSDAYDAGIGAWDKVAIAYGYSEFAPGTDERQALEAMLQQAWSDGLQFISDADARPAGGAHPFAHLWDNGANAIDELNRFMQVRATALGNFSDQAIRPGMPMSNLEDVLVPIYLSHRYQIEAAAKSLGGLYYTYAVRGDGQKVTDIVLPNEQRRALDALLATLEPAALALPEPLLASLPPKAFGESRGRENFSGNTGVTFDALAPAATATNLTLALIFNAERAARLVEYHARDNRYPGFDEVIDKVLKATWRKRHNNTYHNEIQRLVNNAVLDHLLQLAADKQAPAQVRAIALLRIEELDLQLKTQTTADRSWRAHYALARNKIAHFLDEPEHFQPSAAPRPPAGAPIGTTDWHDADLQCDYSYE